MLHSKNLEDEIQRIKQRLPPYDNKSLEHFYYTPLPHYHPHDPSMMIPHEQTLLDYSSKYKTHLIN